MVTKKEYLVPSVSIISFYTKDMITCSGEGGGDATSFSGFDNLGEWTWGGQ